jgi:ketosteroid isomerase-like protein
MRFLGPDSSIEKIRAEVEKRITRGERFGTSVEVPLSEEAKKILNLAAEEAERLGHHHVGTEHLLLGMLQVDGSLAAQVLRGRSPNPSRIREQLAKTPGGPTARVHQRNSALSTLGSFLAGLKWHKAEDLLPYFAANARFVDVHGRQWNREEIEKEFVALFAPYAKKNAAYVIEETVVDSGDVVVAIVLWKNAILASMERIWIHRMSVVLVRKGEDWAIALMQVTPVQPAQAGADATSQRKTN